VGIVREKLEHQIESTAPTAWSPHHTAPAQKRHVPHMALLFLAMRIGKITRSIAPQARYFFTAAPSLGCGTVRRTSAAGSFSRNPSLVSRRDHRCRGTTGSAGWHNQRRTSRASVAQDVRSSGDPPASRDRAALLANRADRGACRPPIGWVMRCLLDRGVRAAVGLRAASRLRITLLRLAASSACSRWPS
jgi:hypothetical protein